MAVSQLNERGDRNIRPHVVVDPYGIKLGERAVSVQHYQGGGNARQGINLTAVKISS